MGPSWVRIYFPKEVDTNSSHCKVEFAIDDPKNIHLLKHVLVDPVKANIPAPPMTVMCLSTKTVVNPNDHNHEVIAISTMVHREANLDGPTEENPSKCNQITCIRPLNERFPHDLQRLKAQQRTVKFESQGNERALLSWFYHRLQFYCFYHLRIPSC